MTETPEAHREAEELWLAQRARRLGGYARQRHVTATGLANRLTGGQPLPEAEEEEHGPSPVEDDRAGVILRGGRAQTAVGKAVHAVLQTIDLASFADLEVLAQAAADQYQASDRAEQIAEFAHHIRDSATIHRVLSEGRCLREVPIAIQIDGVILEGTIDLLHEAPDGALTIVDYKTDVLSDPSVLPQLLDHYRIQLAAYAQALRRILHRPVSHAVLLFARPEQAHEEHLSDLDQVVLPLWHNPPS